MITRIDGHEWFLEINDFWKGRALGVSIDKLLFEGKSKFQEIKIFQTANLGKMLVLDNAIQLTESDEFAYHEMFVHVPMNAHPHPENILVIGGGDGGILRELIKYKEIKVIDFVEIDEMVIEISKKYLPFTACGFDDQRINIEINDGAEFLQSKKDYYDVILVDSSDPDGPANVLFQKPFFVLLHDALRDRGLAVTQAESIWLHLENVVKPLYDNAKTLFKNVDYYMTMVPTYPSGMIGLMGCSKGGSLREISRTLPAEIAEALRYYSPESHQGAFLLPRFVLSILEGR